MTTLLESPWPALILGGIAIAVASALFLARRDGISLAALSVAAFLTLGMVLLERMVTTEKEHVEAAIAGMLAAIETNEADRVLEWVDPGATRVRGEVVRLMPEIDVQQTGTMGRIDVVVKDTSNPPTAEATILAYLDGIHRKSGIRVPYYKQRVDFHLVKRGERWLLDDFTAYWQGGPIDAASSAAANRAVSK